MLNKSKRRPIMTKSESKYFNTAIIMDEAMLRLLAIKDIQFITVKELCKNAGVNRSTFYLHYETIGDLLDETTSYVHNKFINSFSIDAEDFINSINDMPLKDLILINETFLRPYLDFIRSNKHVYKAAINNPSSMKSENNLSIMYKNVLKPIFTRFNIPEIEQKYWLQYHICGIMAIVQEWLKDDCQESTDDIIRIIENCVRADHTKELLERDEK